MTCNHVFDENSFALMETLVNGSVLGPVERVSLIFFLCLFVCSHVHHVRSANSSSYEDGMGHA